MKKITGILVLLIIFCMAACQENHFIEKVQTLTVTPVSTTKMLPTSMPSTPSLTPMVTKTETMPPEFVLSTFDPSSVITVTPAQPAVCPAEDPEFIFESELLALLEQNQIIDFVDEAIDSGASAKQILSQMNDLNYYYDPITLEDITGDKVDEIILSEYGKSHMVVYKCMQNKYIKVLDFEPSGMETRSADIVGISDMNLNGLPDMAIIYGLYRGMISAFNIFEWDGNTFISLRDSISNTDELYSTRIIRGLFWNLGAPYTTSADTVERGLNCNSKIEISDMDANGTVEVVMRDGYLCELDMWLWSGPWLIQELTFSWNGESFLLSDYRIDDPVYRYQAVQEADRAFLIREYDRAQQLYKEVINNSDLEWWSRERMDYEYDSFMAEIMGQDLSELQAPAYNEDEEPSLSAYALYRLLILQLAAGNQSDALETYNQLNQIYIGSNPGNGYAEMGRIYWDAIEQGMNLVDACRPVINYAEKNRKLLEVLGDLSHRGQSHIYLPMDVCPLDELDVELLSGVK